MAGSTGKSYAQGGAPPPIVAVDGSVDGNTAWESGTGSLFIELQGNNLYLIPNGIARENEGLLNQGLSTYAWANAHEQLDGSYPPTGDKFHSTNVYLLWAAQGIYFLKQYNPFTYSFSTSPFASSIATDTSALDLSAHWTTTPSVLSAGKVGDNPYTHRRFLNAAALCYTSAIANDPALLTQAHAYVDDGLSRQLGPGWQAALAAPVNGVYAPATFVAPGATPPAGTVALISAEGVAPEESGYDVNYQCVGVLGAEQYYAFCTDAAQKARVLTYIVNGLKWEESRISPSGIIDITGCRRMGLETNRDGTLKQPNIPEIIAAFDGATALTGDPSYAVWARRIDEAQFPLHSDVYLAPNGAMGANAAYDATATTSSTSLGATADAYTQMKSPTVNTGTATTLLVKNNDPKKTTRWAYLSFNVSSIPGAITSATLKLYGKSGNTSADSISIYGVPSNNWTSTGITWSNQPTPVAPKLSSASVPTIAQWTSWDVSSFVNRQRLFGATTVTLAVEMDAVPAADQAVTFNSHEASSKRPTLIINYTRPVAAPVSAGPSADAYAYMKSITTNYGASNQLVLKNSDFNQTTRVSYLQFDLSAATFPPGKATLSLYGKTSNPAPDSVSVYGVDNANWSETGIDWVNKPAISTNALASALVPLSAAWNAWDVSGYVDTQLAAGNKHITLALQMDNVPATGQSDILNSKEATSNPPSITVLPAIPTAVYNLGLQTIGADWIEAGVRREDPALIGKGVQALTWGLGALEADNANGAGFDSAADGYDGAIAFTEALARSTALLEHYSPSTYSLAPSTYSDFVARSVSDLGLVNSWLILPSTQAEGSAADATSASCRLQSAAALEESAEVTGSSDAGSAAQAILADALTRQGSNGSFPDGGVSTALSNANCIIALARYCAASNASGAGPGPTGPLTSALSAESTFFASDGTVNGQPASGAGTIAHAFHLGTMATGMSMWDVYGYRVETAGLPATSWSEPLE